MKVENNKRSVFYEFSSLITYIIRMYKKKKSIILITWKTCFLDPNTQTFIKKIKKST